jgi:hypothetical protein
MTSSILVKDDLERAWAFLSDQSNAPRWDRSVARADLLSPPPLRVGSLSFTLVSADPGVRISHEIVITPRFPWAILIPVLALFKRRALAADLDSLRRALEEGHDLTKIET